MRQPESSQNSPGFDPEWEVLTAAVAAALDPGRGPTLEHLLQTCAPNWGRLLALAERHCVIAPLYRSLTTHLGTLPAEIGDLRNRFRINRVRNRTLSRELIRLNRLFSEAGIAIIPYKGPEMAQRCYGDVALRQFKDVDFLIRRRDLRQVCELLVADGYHSEMPADPQLQRYRERHFKEWSFLRHDVPGTSRVLPDLRLPTHPKFQALILEPHWAITARRFHLRVDYEGLWRRSHVSEFAGAALRELADADLALILCINACKAGFSRLQLVADVAAALHRLEPTAWEAALERAREADAQRIVLLATRLAQNVLHVPLHPSLIAAQGTDPGITRLSLRAAARVRRGEPDRATARLTGFDPLIMQSWRRRRHRLHYLYESLTEPRYWHLAHLPLPASLHALYRPAVPVMNSLRLLARIARGDLTAQRPKSS